MKYIKLLLIVNILYFVSACSDDFLNTEPSQYASEDQIKDLLEHDPSMISAYVNGFYTNLFAPESQQSHDDFGLKALELATDLMGEDMAYRTSHFFVYDYEWDNRLSSYRRTTQAWQQLYAVISGANEVISTLVDRAGEDDTVDYMLGQSYTMRAYCYFWLINLFQQPYEWNKTALGIPLYTEDKILLGRQPVADVYERILEDVETGYNLLKGKGIKSKSELNEYAAAAIYANVLSFVSDYPDQWSKVAEWAQIAIEGGRLMSEEELLSGFNDVSLSEVLWGVSINAETNTFYASFMSHVDPYGPGYGGELGNYKMISSDLYSKIDDNDIRKKWFGVDLAENDSHYAYRQYVQRKFLDCYTTGTGETFTSDYIYLRTGEMYFVAAEALYLAGQEAQARTMLNTIVQSRNPSYNATASGSALLEEIQIQKRIEMWGEGRRLLDMKRRAEALDRTTSNNHSPIAIQTAAANDYRMIYQIPDREMDANLEITEQNP